MRNGIENENEKLKVYTQMMSLGYAKLKLKFKADSFESKTPRGSVQKKVSENSKIHQKSTRVWTTNKFMTSLLQEYLCAITEQ